jgi:hypothetical protein
VQTDGDKEKQLTNCAIPDERLAMLRPGVLSLAEETYRPMMFVILPLNKYICTDLSHSAYYLM